MKSIITFTVLFAALFFGTNHLSAQSYQNDEIPKFRHQIKLGFPMEIGLTAEIPSTGIHLSYNPTYKLTNYFYAEAQGSYTYADFERSSNTFARDGGDAQSLNFLVGGRIYLFGEQRTFRFYTHVLAGLLQFSYAEFDAADELQENSGYSFGFSTGVFAQYRNQWSLGLTLETRNFIILRGGYTF